MTVPTGDSPARLSLPSPRVWLKSDYLDLYGEQRFEPGSSDYEGASWQLVKQEPSRGFGHPFDYAVPSFGALSDLDNAIEKNLDAALLQNSLHDNVKYDVTNGVVTLTGEVNSEEKRNAVQVIASHVPNVEQVVNKIDVPNQRATSTR